ncbi:MAG: 3-hydroxyacyl-CoA dehydrogenase family protein [Flavobacteriaceae bacterium]|tara:strand:+ start:5367 stop:6254 length:888 start_codon:yes stop_codon:yes gene_type:complete
MSKISVIGAGTMGNGIAQTFALHNFRVLLYDINQENLKNARSTIHKNLNRMLAKESITELEIQNTTKNLIYSNKFKEISSSDLVVEAITENYETKAILFKKLENYCSDDCIFASNTSSISITKISENLSTKHRVIGMHFMNPVPIMKLVEVINGRYTSAEVTKKIIDYSKSINKTPLIANDYPGFISNRILLPMINEAIEALDSGVSDVKSIDGIMKLGMGHPMGPLQLADLIGLDVCKSILEIMHTGLFNEKYKPNKLLIDLVNKGNLGVKSGEGFYNYSNSKKAEVVSKRFLK